MANLKLTIIASMLERVELPIFILFWPCFNSRQKNSFSHVIFALFYSIIIFRFFGFSVFFSRYWPRGFFYQTNLFGFPLPVFLTVWRFFINWSTDFLPLSPVRILGVFHLYFSYNYAHHLSICLLELAS